MRPSGEFCLVDPFLPEHVAAYLGQQRLKLIQNLEADALVVPRSLGEIRRMELDDLAAARTAGDIYWHNVMQVIDKDTAQQRRTRRIRLDPGQMVDLLSLLAFTMLRHPDGPVMQMRLDHVLRRKLHQRSEHLFGCSLDEFRDMLTELLSVKFHLCGRHVFQQYAGRQRNPLAESHAARLFCRTVVGPGLDRTRPRMAQPATDGAICKIPPGRIDTARALRSLASVGRDAAIGLRGLGRESAGRVSLLRSDKVDLRETAERTSSGRADLS